jgi:hypothetical protein
VAKKTGKLTLAEKGEIQQGILKKTELAEIAESINRTELAVTKYVNGELYQMMNALANITEEEEVLEPLEMEDYGDVPGDMEDADVPGDFLDEDIEDDAPVEREAASAETIKAVVKRLDNAGLTKADAQKVVNIVIKMAIKAGKFYKNDNVMYVACIKRMPASNFMKKRTEGGNEGVAMMTGTASSRMDAARKMAARRTTTRSSRGNIYRPDTGTIE